MPIVIQRGQQGLREWAQTLRASEWLLPDGLGGFSMGTALGCATRRQHALLAQSLRPPVLRVCALGGLTERVRIDNGEWTDLSAFRFGDDLVHPQGHAHLARFERHSGVGEDAAARWVWQIGNAQILREIRSLWGWGGVAIRYEIQGAIRTAELEIRPLIALRSLHELTHERDGWDVETAGSPVGGEAAVAPGARVVVSHHDSRLLLATDRGGFEHAPDSWRAFRLDGDAARMQEAQEDLFTPGAFRWSSDGPGRMTLAARLDDGATDADELLRRARTDERRQHLERITGRVALRDETDALLLSAADDFVVRRDDHLSVIAGYPWFADWGRDAMIALPGLLLETGRTDDALSVLRAFARHERGGLLPNCFDDRTGEASYNAADASFWFLRAAGEWMARTNQDTLPDDLAHACASIIEHTARGTSFNIGVDPRDGLITAGDKTTQLTWMDAKQGTTAFTPRHGKPVELSALWTHALRALRPALAKRDGAMGRRMDELRDKAAASFESRFRTAQGWLADRLAPDGAGGWTQSAEVRPNMLWGAALEHAPVSIETRRATLARARDDLLTPQGLRTLAPGSDGYCARYEGDMWSRDRAYHNGTVWPWLIGSYVEALLRAGEFSDESRAEARLALRALEESLRSGCLGQIAEVYDADPPRRPDGCPAQAWSVAELIRARALIDRSR